jgi:hypothetical protein
MSGKLGMTSANMFEGQGTGLTQHASGNPDRPYDEINISAKSCVGRALTTIWPGPPRRIRCSEASISRPTTDW